MIDYLALKPRESLDN